MFDTRILKGMIGMTIKAILFDLDNTLINRRLAFEKYTYNFIDKFVKTIDGEDKDEIAKYIIAADQDGYRPKRELYEEIITRCEMKDEKTSVEALLSYWFSEFFKCTILMPGAREILEHFISLNIPLGLITN